MMTATTATPGKTTGATSPALPRMTWEEFLAWVDEDTHAEWVNGEVILLYPPVSEEQSREGYVMPSPASIKHQRIHGFLVRLLEAYLSERPVGEMLYAPFLMRLPDRPAGREPDLLVLLNEHRDRIQETYIDGPADLVIEITSEESQARDRGEKFAEYEAAGVTEYWLIDPLRELTDFYRLGSDGRYDRIDPDAEGYFHSAVLPGLRVNPVWLWQESLPNLTQTLDMVREMLAP